MFTMDPPGYWDEFDYYQLDHVRSLVPYNLGPAIQRLLECKGAAIEEFEAARDGLEKAMKEEWKDL
jgi:hypothetical protein